jgi:hypothetical protein
VVVPQFVNAAAACLPARRGSTARSSRLRAGFAPMAGT